LLPRLLDAVSQKRAGFRHASQTHELLGSHEKGGDIRRVVASQSGQVLQALWVVASFSSSSARL
jgi:hypothetical protein